MSTFPVKVWIFLEVLLVCLGIWRLSRFVKAYKNTEKDILVEERIEKMVLSQVNNKVLATFVTRDLLMVYYLFSKTKKRNLDSINVFTLHKKMGYGGMVFGFIFVLLLEGIGVSYFLHNWSRLAAWIHLVLSLYMIAFLIGDYKAIIRNPVLLYQDKIHLRFGLRMKLEIFIRNIERIQSGKINYEIDKKRKDVWVATLLEFEGPNIEIALKEPVLIKDGIGRKHWTRKIYLSLDEDDVFMRQVNTIVSKNEVV
ncbi:hypothetical protein QE429_002833 [Bacillus sp. SORGH_AS 510]|uniref:hypothetical protein n=1 Tax=Bacillus sp. SORGH_AS_0510 TaxID=3041771 RepID=UPI002782C5C8|nr:hypothetical protein [Bacillus sp. SORGH_AS_0510]MDQ1146006.1 hypothetical protein [Bacillus sp. SORGH_AS_0510]